MIGHELVQRVHSTPVAVIVLHRSRHRQRPFSAIIISSFDLRFVIRRVERGEEVDGLTIKEGIGHELSTLAEKGLTTGQIFAFLDHVPRKSSSIGTEGAQRTGPMCA